MVIPYHPLNDEMIAAIARLQLGRIERRIAANHKVPFNEDEYVVKLIAERCTEPECDGRIIDAIPTNTMLPRISGEFLTRRMEGKLFERVHVGVDAGEFSYDFD